uniref:Putative niemann-pick type c-1a n=1 Tax=Ixodes ricinus TaxID=34613 RepID=V5GX94_IXORI
MGTLVVALCALLATQIFARVDGAKCIMRGACDQDGIRGSCPYDGEPQVIDKPEARALLEGICGDVFANSSQPLCCDADQLDDFHENFESARVLGLDNCPACSVNFRALLCSMTCSPRQSDFLRLIKTAVNEEDKTTHVAEIDYHLTPSFANGLFDSCVDTRSRIASIPLLNFMCGKWAQNCTAERWLGFLGSTPARGGLSPFDINFVQVTQPRVVDGTTYLPLPLDPQKCNQSRGRVSACSCEHCKAAC